LTEPTRPEDALRARPTVDLGTGPLSLEATRLVLNDLRVHQIELELQNEEMRRTQQQLEASRARYFDLYELAPVGYFTLSETGLIQEANLTAASLLGVEREALVKQPLTRFILPADQDIYYRHRKQLETGALQVCELRMLRGEGEPSWVRLEATSMKDASGALVCRAVMSDITARRHAEDTLKASEAVHRLLFEKSHDALMTLTPPAWHFTSGNSATLAMFGVRDEENFVSRAPSDYSPKRQPDGCASAEQVALMIETAMRDGSHFYEWTFQRLSGQEFPATVLLTRIEIDGRPLLQATVRDETEVKRMQAMLGQADRLASMGMLAAGVAHEINNPLVYVLYNIETLAEDLPKLAGAVERCLSALRGELGDEAVAKVVGDDAAMLEPSMLKDMIERARDALDGTQRIRTISKAIGTFSRVESTEQSRVDLNHAIECAATMALNDIKVRAKLVVDFGQLPPIWASEGKLSQVFLNLLINAVQSIDEGNVQQSSILIRTWVEGDNVLAEVQDTGKGISEENLKRIFEPFFTTKSVGVGSGLGLSICRNIIAEFGGDISAASEIGKGTRFVVRLPIQRGVSLAPRSKPASDKPGDTMARGRVLVVDDEQAIRTMMTRILGADHDLITVASGEAARAILEHDQSFDVILCDLMMPEMTGMDLHKWLATQYPALARQVVFITGGAFTPKASEYVTRVGNLRLEKPFERTKLKRLVLERIAAAHKHGLMG
jgi:two-component system cell cycle sensor histidine kinase/response regulator CckA